MSENDRDVENTSKTGKTSFAGEEYSQGEQKVTYSGKGNKFLLSPVHQDAVGNSGLETVNIFFSNIYFYPKVIIIKSKRANPFLGKLACCIK